MVSGLPWWTGFGARTNEKHLLRIERLDRLGISKEDFEMYKHLFLRRRVRNPYSEQTEDENWPQQELRRHGVIVQSGICEVRMGASPDRLPFGLDSMLLDPLTFESIYHLNLTETLKIVDSHRLNCAVDSRTVNPGASDSDTQNFPSEQADLIERLLNEGLSPNETTNDSLQLLAWNGRVRMGLNDTQLNNHLLDWVTAHHNGNSKTINDGKIGHIEKHIDRIIRNLRAQPSDSIRAVAPTGLTEAEIRKLIEFPGNLKTISGVFKIVRAAKTKLIRDITNRPPTGFAHTSVTSHILLA